VTDLARKTSSFVVPVVLALVAAVFLTGGSPFLISIATITVIWAVLALGLNLLMGYSGLINLGIGAFYALGAYGTAILANKWDTTPWLMLLLMPAVGFVLGLAIGPVVLRTRGLHFAVATLGIGIVVSDVLENWVDVTKGPIGLAGIERPGEIYLGVATLDPTEPGDFFVILLALLVIIVAGCLAFHRSRLAAVLVGSRDDEMLAKSLGFSVTFQRILAFALSCALAAAAGVMYAWYVRYLSPPPFSFFLASFPAFVLVAVGGPGSVWGPVLGAVFLTAFPELVEVDATTMPILYGTVLLVVMVLLPKGLVPGGRDLVSTLGARRWTSSRRHGVAPPSTRSEANSTTTSHPESDTELPTREVST
jgi:branched-chain amino acid transport system permease protein